MARLTTACVWSLLVLLLVGHWVQPSRAMVVSRAEAFATIEVILCLDDVVVYSVRTGEVPALCAYSPSSRAVLWRKITTKRVNQAVPVDTATFAIIENGELQLCSLITGVPIRRIALVSLPWGTSVDEDGFLLPYSADRSDMSFHSPRITPSGICVWRDSYPSDGWGVIGDRGDLLLSSPDGQWLGYAPNGRPLFKSGSINPRIKTFRGEQLVDATDLLFRQLKTDYPDMDLSLFPSPGFSRPGTFVVAMRRRDAPRLANGRIHHDRVVVLHVDSGSFQLMRSTSRRDFYESWVAHGDHVYRYSSSSDPDVGNQKSTLWIEVYDMESGIKRAERSLSGLDERGTLWLRGFTSEGDAVFVYERYRDVPSKGSATRSDSQIFILDTPSLATRRTWSLSVDGGPAWAHDVEVSDAHGIVQTFGSASMMRMPSSGTRHHAMGIRVVDPLSGEERWRHTEHLILEKNPSRSP